MKVSTLFLALYLCASAFHLVCCFLGKARPQAISKLVLMPLLLGFAISFALSGEIPHMPWIISGAVFCGFLGDALLLLPDNRIYFLAGLSAFLVGHLLYTLQTIRTLQVWPPLWGILLTAAVLTAVGIAAYHSLKGGLGDMKLPCIVYLVIILMMAFFALLLFFGKPTFSTAVTAVGGIFFLISDYLLAYGIFKGAMAHGSFWVMLTYLAAQLSLVWGLLCR